MCTAYCSGCGVGFFVAPTRIALKPNWRID